MVATVYWSKNNVVWCNNSSSQSGNKLTYWPKVAGGTDGRPWRKAHSCVRFQNPGVAFLGLGWVSRHVVASTQVWHSNTKNHQASYRDRSRGCAIKLEMKNVRVAFEDFDGHPNSLVGYTQITGHLLFDASKAPILN